MEAQKGQVEETHSKHEDMELARPTRGWHSHALTRTPRRFLPGWDLLSLLQLLEQLEEKVTGRQSFQQTEVLAREGRPPEEAGSR